jgi:predicted nucleic acid-binding protein
VTLLVDTSVWIDYLRGAETPARWNLRQQLAHDDPGVVMAEPIAMELLAGPTSERVAADITRLVNGLPTIPLEPQLDFRSAASIFRACRRSGQTVRSLTDCVIAAVAIRSEVTLVHRDADFEVIARVTSLDATSWR